MNIRPPKSPKEILKGTDDSVKEPNKGIFSFFSRRDDSSKSLDAMGQLVDAQEKSSEKASKPIKQERQEKIPMPKYSSSLNQPVNSNVSRKEYELSGRESKVNKQIAELIEEAERLKKLKLELENEVRRKKTEFDTKESLLKHKEEELARKEKIVSKTNVSPEQKEALSAKEKEIAKAMKELQVKEKQVKELISSRESKNKMEELDAKEKKLNEASQKLATQLEKLKDYEQKLLIKNKELQEKESEVITREKPLLTKEKNWLDVVSEYEKKIDELKAQKEILVKEVKGLIPQVEEAKKEYILQKKELLAQISQMEKSVSICKSQLADLSSDIGQKHITYAQVKKRDEEFQVKEKEMEKKFEELKNKEQQEIEKFNKFLVQLKEEEAAHVEKHDEIMQKSLAKLDSELRKQESNLIKSVQDKKEELDQLNKNLNSLRNVIDIETGKLSQLKDEFKDLNSREAKVQEAEETQESLKISFAKKEDALKAKEHNLMELERKLKSSTSAVTEKLKASASLLKESESIRELVLSQLKDSETKMGAMLHEWGIKESSLDILSSTIKDNITELEKAKGGIKEMSSSLVDEEKSILTAIKHLEHEKSLNERTLESKEREIILLVEEMEKERADIEADKETIMNKLYEVEALEKSMRNMEKEFAKRESDLKDQMAEIEVSKKSIERVIYLKDELPKLENAYANLSGKVRKITDEAVAKRELLKATEQQLVRKGIDLEQREKIISDREQRISDDEATWMKEKSALKKGMLRDFLDIELNREDSSKIEAPKQNRKSANGYSELYSMLAQARQSLERSNIPQARDIVSRVEGQLGDVRDEPEKRKLRYEIMELKTDIKLNSLA